MELTKEQLALLRDALATESSAATEEANEIIFKKGPKSDETHRKERALRVRADKIRELIDYIDNADSIDKYFKPRGFNW